MWQQDFVDSLEVSVRLAVDNHRGGAPGGDVGCPRNDAPRKEVRMEASSTQVGGTLVRLTTDILLVIGDLRVASIIAEALSDERHTVRAVTDWQAARARLAEKVPDVLIVDFDVPMTLDDWQAVRGFVHEQRNLAMILTGSVDDVSPDLRGSVDDPVMDRFNIERLHELIRRYDARNDD